MSANPRTVILDTEAMSAVAQRDSVLTARLVAAVEAKARVLYPSLILAELITGKSTDAAVWHVANRLPVVDVDRAIASAAGVLRQQGEVVRRKKRDLTVDALVAAVAVAMSPSVVITADPNDFELLVHGHDVRIEPL